MKSPPPAPSLESVTQFARRAGMPRSTVYAGIASGDIPAVRLGGALRIPTGWLDQRIQQAIDAAKGQQA